MKLLPQTLKKSLNKAYLKEKVNRADIEVFKKNLNTLLSKIDEEEFEEHLKNVISAFLKDTWYKDQYEINTKNRKDLVIHNGKSTKEPVGVILEVKKPSNKAEMISIAKPNAKAMHELILYYLQERIPGNINIKYLIVTNIYEWYIIDEVWFEKNVYRNSKLIKDYENYKLSGKDTKFFYESIAKPFFDSIEEDIPCTHFDIREYEKIVQNNDKKDDNKLIALYKIFSPAHLLKQPFANDSNSLDTKFYTELLHIIGLEEIKDGSKKLIKQKEKPEAASLLENTIIKLEDKDSLRNISNLSSFGATRKEQLFNIALELCITWINRILFLKLLEAQLSKYHKEDKDYLFLNTHAIFDFDELSNLFFQVLAEKQNNRRDYLKAKFSKIPYLNSSLFERTELERQTFDISALDNRLELPIHSTTVLKNEQGKRKSGKLPVLQYLFEFLNAYDFTSEGAEEIQEENKGLINASVLGLIFEKINGYKDGSFFTPGFVTMYMCKETIRRAVVQKFNEIKVWDCKNIKELFDKISDKKEANDIINHITVCDPAVGSGHFLVSALNEIIAIKSELKILLDLQGQTLRDYHVEVVNDELIITDDDGRFFEYHYNNKESQRVQETFFYEKATIIENCLFGVDINPNSVKICRLRLWIELLKNAYYTNESKYTELETLPNIDINIKCGNSLISRFALNSDIKEALHKSKWTIDTYRLAVQTYRQAENKEQKREMEELIETIKKDFTSELSFRDKVAKNYVQEKAKIVNISSEINRLKLWKEKIPKKLIDDLDKASKKLEKLDEDVRNIQNNVIYNNAFEWRFEFPEVLNSEGGFIGFDVVIGNPPYLTGSAFKEFHTFYIQTFSTAEYQLDLYPFFIELSSNLLLKNGYVSLITPNSWLKNLKMQKTRKYILDNLKIESINPNISKAFEEAQVDTLIFIASKRNTQDEINIWTFNDKEPLQRHLISQDVFLGNEGFTFDLEVNPAIRNIIKKVRAKSKILEDEFEITRGVNPYDKYRGQSEDVISTKAYHSSFQKDETFKPELRGKHVGTFHYKWDNKHFISYGPWLAAPRDPKFFNGKRIIFREILGKRFVTTIIDEDFILDRSLYIAKPLNDSVNVESILGILSSRLLIWLFRIEKNEFDELFPKIRLEEFKKLPIPVNNIFETKISEVITEIIIQKNIDSNSDTQYLESKLDELVYQVYGLTKDEIKIIENHE